MRGVTPLDWTITLYGPPVEVAALAPGALPLEIRLGDGPPRAVTLMLDATLLDALNSLGSPAGGADARSELADRLTMCLLDAGWADAVEPLARALSAGRRVRLTLRSQSPAVMALPWRLVQPPGFRGPIGQQVGVEVAWAWHGPRAAPRAAPEPGPERVLVGWAGPPRKVPGRLHVDAVAAACAGAGVPFSADDDALPDLTLEALGARLAGAGRRPVSVVHLLLPVVEGPDGAMVVAGGDGAGGLATLDLEALVAALSPHAHRLRALHLLAVHPSGDAGALVSLVAAGARLHAAGIEAVLMSRHALTRDGALLLTRTLFDALLVGPESLEQAAAMGLRALQAQAGDTADALAPVLLARPAEGPDCRPITLRPYVGAAPYAGPAARLWFGREPEVEALLADLLRLDQQGRPRLMVVAGQPGVGRRSLLHAGVAPELADEGWQIRRVRLGERPREALRGALAGLVAGQPAAILVDDLESLVVRASRAEAEACLRELWALAEGPDGATVLAAMRLDLLGHLDRLTLADGRRFDAVVLGDARHRQLLPRIGRKALRDAVRRPAERVGLVFEPGLVRTVVRDAEAHDVSLLAVQLTLDMLWAHRRGRVLGADAYAALGGVAHAAAGALEAARRGLERPARRALDHLLSWLVRRCAAGPWVARPVPVEVWRSEAPGGPASADQALALLETHRLVHHRDGAIELTHEALVSVWPRLTGSETLGSEGPAPVPPAPTLDRVEGAGGAVVRLLPDGSGAALVVDAQGGLLRWQPGVPPTSLALAGVADAVAVPGLGWVVAEQDGRLSHHPGFGAQPSALPAIPDPPTALAAGADGWLVVGDARGGVHVRQAGAPERGTRLGRHRDAVTQVAFAPAGQRLASASRDGTARLWRPGESGRVLPHDGAAVLALVWTPGGELITGDEAGVIRLWRDDAAQVLGRVAGGVLALTLVADGTAVVAAGMDGGPVWLPLDGGPALTLAADAAHRLLAVGAHVLAGGADGTVSALLASGEGRLVGMAGAEITALAVDPQAGWVAAGGADGALLAWPWPLPDEPGGSLSVEASREALVADLLRAPPPAGLDPKAVGAAAARLRAALAELDALLAVR
ncbi:MAG: hypothetical protein H6702_19545 [Myxococcales bacterium]|nr:hypothetical protein [Myxococcales bacterium]